MVELDVSHAHTGSVLTSVVAGAKRARLSGLIYEKMFLTYLTSIV